MFKITESQRCLVEMNHGLIYSFLKKYNLSENEYYDLAAIGLCKAATNYDNSTKFSTYAYKCMFTTVFQEIRNQNAAKRTPRNPLIYYYGNVKYKDKDVPLIDILPGDDGFEERIISNIYYEQKRESLKERDKMVLDLMRDGYNQYQIAEKINYSQPQVSRICKKIIQHMFGGTENE